MSITPEDREAGIPVNKLIELAFLGGDLPKPASGKGGLTGKIEHLGWRIIPIPNFWSKGQLWHDRKGNGNPAYIDFDHAHEFLIVPPESSEITARKVTGKVCAIREAYRLAMSGEVAS
jgi:hypothetical protein